MKDKRLEEQFNGYFEGVEAPDIRITEDAKKLAAKPSRLPRLAKIASIAASVVVCVTAAALITVNILPRADGTAPPDASAPDDIGDSSAPSTEYYGDGELVTANVNAYAASKVDPSLKFIERLSLSPNASVSLKRSDFENGGLALVRAEAVVVASARYEAEIFVEYTQKVYSPLSEYSEGEAGYYGGMAYRLTRETAENGEPVNKLLVERGGVKYYFNVQSSDINSYLLCLELLKF